MVILERKTGVSGSVDMWNLKKNLAKRTPYNAQIAKHGFVTLSQFIGLQCLFHLHCF
jgi:hypothetical protein